MLATSWYAAALTKRGCTTCGNDVAGNTYLSLPHTTGGCDEGRAPGQSLADIARHVIGCH